MATVVSDTRSQLSFWGGKVVATLIAPDDPEGIRTKNFEKVWALRTVFSDGIFKTAKVDPHATLDVLFARISDLIYRTVSYTDEGESRIGVWVDEAYQAYLARNGLSQPPWDSE